MNNEGKLLRANLIQPLTSIESIKMRQHFVQNICENQELAKALRRVLEESVDVDSLISSVTEVIKFQLCKTVSRSPTKQSECRIGQIILIKQSITVCEKLSLILADAKQDELLSLIMEVLFEFTC